MTLKTLVRLLAVLLALFLFALIYIADSNLFISLWGWFYNVRYLDKITHFVLFGLLAMLISLGFPTRRVRLPLLHPQISTLVLAAVTALEELSQAFIPGRHADPRDLISGWLGILLFGELGAWLRQWYLARRIRQQKQTGSPR